ncbi:uncharacterized protein [Drosophila pseudoobscura]|uniref:Uncharacterized protein n=1 Tax=Drosophila pseudoobscura pseudoobscura TaxID=46245 RepID=A0A6I8W5W9_DROPS|nr:uncharacterized protein LOC4815681 [Drosophila pseudoobscura]XP_033238742.1 uncharacterized protein LOC4815681 [Drosophila pseudoobscura]XP_033238743.1 uncharacterized protein LOC4815681 [Drosophila pseudoobscura]XP_033238744.1 uncharacterized protein LOC4815681 [Drosophila pseudoobscura]XP_033238745.1 uncharacterized protein LOC4815681 [Drosophila pseudoobscura]
MLKHASNASSASASASASATVPLPVPPVTVALPLNGQLLRTASACANSSTSSSNNNNSNSHNGNGNGSSGSGNNTPSVPTGGATAAAGAGGTAATTTTTSGPVSATAAAGAGSPTPAAAALASTARNIHLRPPQPQPQQQPLNISALNASTCSTLLNGGCRVSNAASNLLNIAMPTTPTPLKPLTPLTPLTPNGHCNSNGSLHHHTYTNQHILASSHHQQQQQQQQQQTLPLPAQPQLSHSLMQPQSPQQPQHISQLQQHNYSNCNNLIGNPILQKLSKPGPSPREALTSLGLLCLSSLLLALLSLIFLLKISPNGRDDALSRGVSSEDFIIVYDVTLALCALSLSLNLCCLLVCAIQFLFAVKLRSPAFEGRDNKYLEKSSASRTCAVSGFFISIPVFLTGIILYTFNHFHSTPAIITSVLIGVGIVFCGGAMVHNVFVWQKEKTISYRSAPLHGTLVGSLPHNMSLLSAAQLPLPLPLSLPPVQFHAASPPPLAPPPMQLYQGHHACMLQPTSVTPVSPNHSHGSFNPLLCNNTMGGGGGAINSSFLVRPATATPPTPKPISGGAGSCLVGREASGSVSPGIPPTLDMSNITISLHELSTLV